MPKVANRYVRNVRTTTHISENMFVRKALSIKNVTKKIDRDKKGRRENKRVRKNGRELVA